MSQTELSYHGNPNLKPIGYEHDFTKEQLEEFVKCEQDPIYFIENYCQIVTLDKGLQPFKLYDCQKRKVDFIMNNRKTILMEGRQQGKTVTAAACIVHYSVFNADKNIAIMANKTSAAREVLSRYQIMYENLPIWMQQGVKTWNKGDVDLENGSRVFTSATTASGIRGKSVNWLYIDEAAIIPNNIADEFFASVYPTISAGETTKILLTSTPLGYNHFWKFWNESEKGTNGFENMFIPHTEIPGRDDAWIEEQFKLLGEVKFNQEVLCDFLGSTNTLISGKSLSTMSSTDPVYKKDGLEIYEEPKEDKYYVIAADTARGIGGDFSAFIVIDITEMPFRVVGKYRDNKISPLLYPDFINKVAKDYNGAYVLLETNDIGQQVVDILHQELEYENIFSTVQEKTKQYVSPGFGKQSTLGVRTSKAVKRQGCLALKSLIEEQKFLIFDADCISELSTFVERHGSFAADEGYHDDLAMCMVLFAWLSTNTFFKDLTNVDIRDNLYNSQMRMIENDLTPFGLVVNGQEPEAEVMDGDYWIWADEKENFL
ncbi:MAG: terminase [Actinobacteria bacterium]|nr:terminase [Actinomycetota bacterium]|tara:strand:- start:51031 stop:52659 length:1629 start_codon:yes stop_codon:yes gene_type:complete